MKDCSKLWMTDVLLKKSDKVLRDKIQGITKQAIRHLAHRGGVKRISGLIYEETRGVLKVFLDNVCLRVNFVNFLTSHFPRHFSFMLVDRLPIHAFQEFWLPFVCKHNILSLPLPALPHTVFLLIRVPSLIVATPPPEKPLNHDNIINIC